MQVFTNRQNAFDVFFPILPSADPPPARRRRSAARRPMDSLGSQGTGESACCPRKTDEAAHVLRVRIPRCYKCHLPLSITNLRHRVVRISTRTLVAPAGGRGRSHLGGLMGGGLVFHGRTASISSLAFLEVCDGPSTRSDVGCWGGSPWWKNESRA
mmetsp:Transcript_35802/g.83815  ORF Transcript_35802/g.83815 Transcript_35802/m.83815 type:complete len:156 (-) Transcript_35802:283-750(-)